MEGQPEEDSDSIWSQVITFGLNNGPIVGPATGLMRAVEDENASNILCHGGFLILDVTGVGYVSKKGGEVVIRYGDDVVDLVRPLVETVQGKVATQVSTAVDYVGDKLQGLGDQAVTWMSETSNSVVGGLADAANWTYSFAAGMFGRGRRIALNVEGKQFGQKMAQRARELGLDPSNPQVRTQFRSRIQRIFDNADEVRSGVFRGQGPNNTEGPVLFFRRGHDVVVTTPNGDFVTLLIGGINNSRFINGVPLP